MQMRPKDTAVRAHRLTSPVLVGRERELALLLEAASSPPVVVLVEGEAGVGKTRLVAELLAHHDLRAHRRFVGHCHQLSEPFPLGPVVEALREARPNARTLNPVVGALRPLLPELADSLPEAPEPLGDRHADRHRTFRAVRELLAALGPTVLTLEDLQWADLTTVELLRFLAPQLPDGLTLVCTYRGEDLAAELPLAGAPTRLSLSSLDRGQVRDLVGTILELDDVSEEFANYLFERSGGLPFAVEEVLRLLEDREDLVRRSGIWVRRELEEIEVPQALRSAIAERMQRLGPEAQQIVKAAAVLGGPTDEAILIEVAGVPDAGAAAALAGTLASNLLHEPREGVYDFRHSLARQAIADAIPAPLRRRLHLRAAHALEAAESQPLARLAHHYREAGKAKEWIRYAEAAADRAVSLQDDAAAYGFLKEAVHVADLPPATRGRLAVKLATHARLCLEHDEAITIVRGLLDDASLSAAIRGELRIGLAFLLHQAGETEIGYLEVADALDDLASRPDLAARAMAFLGRPWATRGRISEHLAWMDRAAATAARSSDPAVAKTVAIDRAVTLLSVGDPHAWAAIEELPEPGSTADDLKLAIAAQSNLASACLKVGHYARGQAFIDEGLRLAAGTGNAQATTALEGNGIGLDWLSGRWDGLEQRVRKHIEAMEDWPQFRGNGQVVLGLLLLARGDVRSARRLLEPVADDYHGMLPMLNWLAAGLARIRVAEANPALAVEETERALDPIRRKDAWIWAADVTPVAVETLLALDRRREARGLTNELAAGLRGREAPAAIVALACCEARLVEAELEQESAAETLLGAERAWQALPAPYEAARAREAAGRCLLGVDPERGRQLLVGAIDAFRSLGAAWDVGRVNHALRERGLAVPHRRGRKGYGDQLSPREKQVARLAYEGLTNREIAVALFLSPKTVERYLGSAMRKLGVGSRTELPELLDAETSQTAAASARR
jgi:DNA-binding CsgD family transcriptional regulator